MKKLFKVFALFSVLLFLSTPVWSFDYFDHVSQAPNGKGDVLIYPTYLVLDGSFETKIQVINTSEHASAVAKVVIRSAVYSQELRDFFIFLSPTDMWEGVLKISNGNVVIYSEDGSTLTSSAPTFASADSPFEFELVQPICNDTEIYGYAEVFLGYVFDEDAFDDGDRINLTEAIVPKEVIYNAYVGDGTLQSPNPIAGDFPAFVDPQYRNILAGNMQIQAPLAGWSSALNATVLKDYGVQTALTPAVETVFDAPAADNNFIEVEAALSKNWVGMPYNYDVEGGNFTLHMFNFPTKLMRRTTECIYVPRGLYEGFPQVDVAILGLDTEENSKETLTPIVSPFDPEVTTFDEEVSLWFPSSYEKGWYRYILDNGPTSGETVSLDGLTYTGAPVIPFALNFGADGFSTMYAFWTDGTVTADDLNDLPLRGYQYVNSFAVTPENNVE
jgi:hypothetical protein